MEKYQIERAKIELCLKVIENNHKKLRNVGIRESKLCLEVDENRREVDKKTLNYEKNSSMS